MEMKFLLLIIILLIVAYLLWPVVVKILGGFLSKEEREEEEDRLRQLDAERMLRGDEVIERERADEENAADELAYAQAIRGLHDALTAPDYDGSWDPIISHFPARKQNNIRASGITINNIRSLYKRGKPNILGSVMHLFTPLQLTDFEVTIIQRAFLILKDHDARN
jgi:hypothetical protein